MARPLNFPEPQTPEQIRVGQLAQADAIAEHLVHADRIAESFRRTDRIMARCYPQVPVGQPFNRAQDRRWFMSPERAAYRQERVRKAAEIRGRILAKIKARKPVSVREQMARAA